MNPQNPATIIDNRYMKVLSAKKDLLKDSIVLVYLNEEQFGHLDSSQIESMVEQIDTIEPSGCYLAITVKNNIEIYEKNEIKNKNVTIVFKQSEESISSSYDLEKIKKEFSNAFSSAQQINFVFCPECDIKIS